MLENKTVVLGVSGGIAAYKALELTSRLVKAGACVKVIMTKNAAEFVTPLSFQSLSGNPVTVDMFEEPKQWEIKHISLAKSADVFAVVPATANVIGKIACGIADDMLTTTIMAAKAPKLIAPAMNTNMFENPIVQENIERLKRLGDYHFVMPSSGRLACGHVGTGKLADIDLIFKQISELLCPAKSDLCGKKIVVSAGATREALDPVRFISNRSTGKMGFALASAAKRRGADVTLIAGVNTCSPIDGINIVRVESALEMFDAVKDAAGGADAVIMAAAVSDFRPKEVAENKIKKSSGAEKSVVFVKNPDILEYLGKEYGGEKVIVGFAMETEDLLNNAADKCRRKNADFIVANNLNTVGAGFGTDTNVAAVIDKNGTVCEYPIMEKSELSDLILDKVCEILSER